MYTCYISKYKDGDSIIDTPVCIYDKRSPALDMRVSNPILELQDSAAGSFKFVLPRTHFMYDKIVEKLTEVTVKDDDEVIFEGAIYSNEKDWYMNKQVVAEGYPAYLNDTMQPRREFFNISMKDYLKALLDVHNEKSVHKVRIIEGSLNPDDDSKIDVLFPEQSTRSRREQLIEHGEVNTTKSEISTYEATQYESTMYYLLSLKARCRGHFIFTRLAKNDYKLDYVTDLELPDNAQTIAIGENLLDYGEATDYQLLCTSVLPVARASTGVTTEIGNVLAIVPETRLRLGEVSQIDLLTDSDCQVGDYIYISNNSQHFLYAVTGFYKGLDNLQHPNAKKLTDHFILHQCCAIGKVDQDRDLRPVYFNNANKDIWEYRHHKTDPNDPIPDFFPTVGSQAVYYVDTSTDPVRVYDWNGSGYVLTADDARMDMIPYRVLEIINIPGIKPLVNRFYISARTHNLVSIRDIDIRYFYALSYTGALVGWAKVNDDGWTSAKDTVLDISYSSDGAKYRGSTNLLVASWGGAIPPMIKREAYWYDPTDLTIGEELDFDEVIGTEHRAEVLTNYFIFNYGEWYGEGGGEAYWHWSIQTIYDERYNGFSVLKLYVKDLFDAMLEEDMNQKPHANVAPRKIYISTRSIHFTDEERKQEYPDEARDDGPLWYAVDASDQVLYKKDKDTDQNVYFTSVINEVIDLNSPELFGAKYIYIGCFGQGIPVKANYYVEQSGSLQNYITVETASDYYIKKGEGETGDECLHEEGSLYVESPSLIEKYGRIEKKVEFNNVNSPEMLCEKAVDYLVNSQFGEVTREIQGVDLHNQNVDIQAFRISTKVPVFSPAHNCNRTFDLLGLTITLDNPADSSIKVSEQITMEDRLREVSE